MHVPVPVPTCVCACMRVRRCPLSTSFSSLSVIQGNSSLHVRLLNLLIRKHRSGCSPSRRGFLVDRSVENRLECAFPPETNAVWPSRVDLDPPLRGLQERSGGTSLALRGNRQPYENNFTSVANNMVTRNLNFASGGIAARYKHMYI